jgi:hypothetical protein
MALVSGLAIGCPGDDDDNSSDADGGGLTADQDAAAPMSGGGGDDTVTSDPGTCSLGNLRLELLDGFGNIDHRVCDVCFDDNSGQCAAAPFGKNAIECFIRTACNTPHLYDSARCLPGALATEHGTCNQEGMDACNDDCYQHTLSKVVRKARISDRSCTPSRWSDDRVGSAIRRARAARRGQRETLLALERVDQMHVAITKQERRSEELRRYAANRAARPPLEATRSSGNGWRC